jgi:hypothetical protein
VYECAMHVGIKDGIGSCAGCMGNPSRRASEDRVMEGWGALDVMQAARPERPVGEADPRPSGLNLLPVWWQ